MPQFSYGTNGEIILHSKYSKRGVGTIHDIFEPGAKTSKLLKVKGNKSLNKRAEYGNPERVSDIVNKIFIDYLLMVFDSVTDGNLFILPGKTNANIALKPVNPELLPEYRQQGSFTEIDVVKAQFKVPKLVFDFGPKYALRDRIIKVPRKYIHKAFKHAENGDIPWTYMRKVIKNDS